VAMHEFLSHFKVTLFLDLASTKMPVEVHDLKTMLFDYVKAGTNDPINKHCQSNNNNEGHNQQESNDHIDDKDDMSDNTEERGMDGVLKRSIDALSGMAGLRIVPPVSLNGPFITDHDNRMVKQRK
jgi:hypothetical protein